MTNLFTVRISTTTSENGSHYAHFAGEARHRSPKVAMRLAKEALGRDFNRDPYGAACGAIYDRMTIRKGNTVILDKEVW
jgi:hypothetical protein